ncbi:MAG TPA: hypothetical protein VHX14_13515 [Thermoanaerobaculia bacterium]|jgi:hypothetical protein|nr:hypothetical protein [Thermoanaerobaculia bacterium]
MADHAHYGEEEIVNPETRHEESDVNTRALLWSVVIFVIFAALTHAVLYLQFHAYARHFRHEASQPLTMMSRPADASVPATPRLQPFPTKNQTGLMPPYAVTPVTDMAEMRASQDKQLREPGWVDQKKGVVRLPIETAKQLVVQRGLPVVTP